MLLKNHSKGRYQFLGTYRELFNVTLALHWQNTVKINQKLKNGIKTCYSLVFMPGVAMKKI